MGARGEGSVVRRVRASTSILFHSAALALSHVKAQRGGARERFLRTTVAKDDRHSASAELSER
jgi:hypothetical protein